MSSKTDPLSDATSISPSFTAIQVKTANPNLDCHLVRLGMDELPPGEVLLRVAWSSVNYKDALAAQGNPGVAGPLPHIPGIDAAGEVVETKSSLVSVGDPVLVTGYQLGAPAWGGWSEYVRVPAAWIIPLPANLTLRQSMVIGTAGFTAAQSVYELQRHDISPDQGPIIVTGATGGVGSWSVRLLHHLGYSVHAVTGKRECADRLRALGATEVLTREQVTDDPQKPLLPTRWAGGIDTVGGSPLTAILKSLQVGGCVAACGLVAGKNLNMTIFPFILRGVKLAGVTSALAPRGTRERIWHLLAGDWFVDYPDSWVTEIPLQQAPEWASHALRGDLIGRVVIAMGT